MSRVRTLGLTVLAIVAAVLLGWMSMLTSALALGAGSALIMGGTGLPDPTPGYVAGIDQFYVQSNFPGFTAEGLFTPEQFWPVTPALGNLTFGESVAQGVADLHTAILDSYTGDGLVVFGFSQSATIATIEIQNLINNLPAGLNPEDLSFILVGNPNNPDGGILERFAGLFIPFLNVVFNGATPPDSPFATDIFSVQYDGIADFPQFPLNPLATLNALFGYFMVHGLYPGLDPADAAALATSPGYDGLTDYFMYTTQDLPLLGPLRQIPYVGQILAELLQPSLRVLVDLGYGDGFANIPTPAGLLPLFNPLTVGEDLLTGVVQGWQAALVTAGVLPDSFLPDVYPYLPEADPLLATSLWNLLTDNSQLGLGGLLGFDPTGLFTLLEDSLAGLWPALTSIPAAIGSDLAALGLDPAVFLSFLDFLG